VITAKASPLTRPTIASRITTRNAFWNRARGRQRPHRHGHGLGRGVAASARATIGASTASATISADLEQAEHGGRQKRRSPD
jgi:hypothetical protein